MKSMNVVFTEPGKVSFQPEEVLPPGAGEIQCRAIRSLISFGTECNCLRGVFDHGTNWENWVKYPFHPGYSMVSEVIHVGSGVSGFKVGDRVFSASPHSQYFNCSVESERSNHIPDSISNEEATWTGLTRIAQNGARRGQVQIGDAVVVIGMGVIGLLSLQFAKIAGACKTIAIDPSESRLELAKAVGADYTFALTAEKAREGVSELTQGTMADVVIESTGNPKVLSGACTLSRNNGRLVLIGDTTEPSKQALGPGVVSNYITIVGSHGGMNPLFDNPYFPWTRLKSHEISYELISQKRLNVADMITHRYSPEEAPTVFSRLLSDNTFATGIIFDWEKI